MKSAGKARNNGLYRHIRTSKEIIRNLLNDSNKNTYIKKNIDYCKLGTLGISSKGERRGTGLYNVKTIINAYNNVIMDTEYENGYFTQLLEIYG